MFPVKQKNVSYIFLQLEEEWGWMRLLSCRLQFPAVRRQKCHEVCSSAASPSASTANNLVVTGEWLFELLFVLLASTRHHLIFFKLLSVKPSRSDTVCKVSTVQMMSYLQLVQVSFTVLLCLSLTWWYGPRFWQSSLNYKRRKPLDGSSSTLRYPPPSCGHRRSPETGLSKS